MNNSTIIIKNANKSRAWIMKYKQKILIIEKLLLLNGKSLCEIKYNKNHYAKKYN